MRIIIGTLFIFLFLTNCAQTSQEHLQKKLETRTESDRSNVGDTLNGSIVLTGKMTLARATHTATLLKNGKVLIAGGFAASTFLSGAEIYDPSLKTFTSVEKMNFARSGHTATLLPNGQVLIAGGYNGKYISSTEIFDPETNMFSNGVEMNVARSGHTTTVLINEKILFAGGVGVGWSFLQSAELYSLKTKTFTLIGSMINARESHTAILLNNGNVLISGGHKDRRDNIKIYSNSELYDPVSGKFKLIGNMHIIRHKHDAVKLADGKILITGGSDERDSEGAYTSAELYDPVTSAFKITADMNITRYKHNGTSILLPGGNVLIAGGANQAEIYNPVSGEFLIVPGNMGTKRLFSCATLLQNGQVLITGGYNQNIEAGANAWLYISKY